MSKLSHNPKPLFLLRTSKVNIHFVMRPQAKLRLPIPQASASLIPKARILPSFLSPALPYPTLIPIHPKPSAEAFKSRKFQYFIVFSFWCGHFATNRLHYKA